MKKTIKREFQHRSTISPYQVPARAPEVPALYELYAKNGAQICVFTGHARDFFGPSCAMKTALAITDAVDRKPELHRHVRTLSHVRVVEARDDNGRTATVTRAEMEHVIRRKRREIGERSRAIPERDQHRLAAAVAFFVPEAIGLG